MTTYIKRFKSRKISHFLRPVKTITGRYTIETRNFNKSEFEPNINYPTFDTLEDAETYLSIVFKEESTT